MWKFHRGALAALILSSSLSAPAWAGDLDDIFTVSEATDNTSLDVGVAAVTRNPYVGSNETDYLVLPFLSGQYKGRFFINPALGAGVHLINKDKFRLSASGSYALGRDDEDTPFVNANDAFEVDGGFTANAAARVYLPFAALDIVGRLPVTGDLEGSRVDALVTTEFHPVPELRITPGVRATYTSSGWNNTYYGIDQGQALAAGLGQTLAFDSGFSTLGAHAAAYWTIAENYELVGAVNYSLLTGDIKDSPLTPDNSGLTAAIGIARKF